MATWIWIVIAVVAFLVGLGVASAISTEARRRRSRRLREQFGPEYERAVRDYHGDRERAEYELRSREQRVRRLQIRGLAPEDRARYAEDWRAVQARFVDDPSAAVTDADHLVGRVMEDRGYPVGDFEQQASLISVDRPRVVENYRAAHEIAIRNERGEASTEDLRNAMIYYRALFQDLVGPDEARRRDVA